MKKYLIYVSLFGSLIGVLLSTPAHAASYSFFRTITTTSTTSVASGTNANFPYLFSGTYSWLEASSSGGRIQNLATAPNGSKEPADLIFATSSANCAGTSLNFETESYVSSTGVIVDWINVPSVSAGTVIYACYGAASVTTDQSHPSSTWNSQYLNVFHLPSPNGILNVSDTLNNVPSFFYSVTATTTIIDGGINNTGGNFDEYQPGSYSSIQNNFSLEGWLDSTNCGSGNNNAIVNDAAGGWYLRCAGGHADFLRSEVTDIVSGGTAVSNAWQFYAVTMDASGNIVLYLNGVSVATTNYTGGFSGGNCLSVSEGNVNNCTSPGNGGEQATGNVDEVRVASGTFTPSWILSEYNNYSSPSTFYTVGAEQTSGGGGGSGEGAILFRIIWATLKEKWNKLLIDN